MSQLYREAETDTKKDWNYISDIRHKLNSKKIHRRVDNPLSPMCRPANLSELTTTNLDRLEDDTNWASWLDGFLCVTKNRKITRITLKFAVYLDCYYRDLPQPRQGSAGLDSSQVEHILSNGQDLTNHPLPEWDSTLV